MKKSFLNETLLADFQKRGGNPAFLDFLEQARHLGYYGRTYALPTDKDLGRIKNLARTLKRELEDHLPDCLPTKNSFDPVQKLPDGALYYAKLDEWFKNEPEENALTWLIETVEERRIAYKQLREPPSGGGRPVRPGDVYYWLAALIPYTCFVSRSHRPDWVWINQWMSEMTEWGVADARVRWRKVIQRKGAGQQGAPRQLLDALLFGSYAFIGFERISSAAYISTLTGTWRDVISPTAAANKKQRAIWSEPFDARERAYLKYVYRYLPVFRGRFDFETRMRFGEELKSTSRNLKPLTDWEINPAWSASRIASARGRARGPQ